MDEEMEDSGELIFTAIEIDLDYEFDAARYFDFTCQETPAEACQSELWFESAGSYPPSPFVTKLILREDILQEPVNTFPKSRGAENMSLQGSDSDNGQDQDYSSVDINDQDYKGTKEGILNNLRSGNLKYLHNQFQQLPTGLAFPNHTTSDTAKAQAKPTVKSSFARVSTLMKSTASQLAKQNRPHQISGSRVSKFVTRDNEKSSNNAFGIETQAAKRQKVEGGHLRKDGGTKQQNVLVHKVSKKDEMIDGNSSHAKLKLTIPREPDLVTTHRAQRMRPKDAPEPENAASTVRRFKARPLNRKILEAPSLLLPKRSTPRLPEFQEFHLKTSERALQHSSAVSSSTVNYSSSEKVLERLTVHSIAENTSREFRRPSAMDASKLEGHGFIHNFKARPLNKKIFSSKGDIGVFRNIKKETTVPSEFKFHTEKRIQHNPPIELFNKLSLNELQSNTQSQLLLPKSTCVPTKGAKENRLAAFQQEHEIKHSVKEKHPGLGQKGTQCLVDGGIAHIDPLRRSSRGLGIR